MMKSKWGDSMNLSIKLLICSALLSSQLLVGGQSPKINRDIIVFNNNITVHLSDIPVKTPGKVIKRSGVSFGDRWILREVRRRSEDDVELYYFFSLDGKLIAPPMEIIGKPVFCRKANRIFIPQASYMSYGPKPTLLLDGDGKVIASIARKGSPFMSGVTKDQQQYWVVWVKSSGGKMISIFDSYSVEGKCVFTKQLSGNGELVEWEYGNKRERVRVKKPSEVEDFY